MDEVVSITPFEQVKITTVSSMTVRVMRIDLFKSATLHVSLIDANGNGFDSKVIEINGDDYKMWGGDDTFVYGFVARKLGFSMPDVVVDTPVVESPVVETPVVESPIVESPVEESPVVESPVVETPIVESPIVESPVEESPVVESPVEESPVVESPVEESPVVEAPVSTSE